MGMGMGMSMTIGTGVRIGYGAGRFRPYNQVRSANRFCRSSVKAPSAKRQPQLPLGRLGKLKRASLPRLSTS